MTKLQAIFSVPELADLADISRYAMGRLLQAAGVPVHQFGSKRWVFLSELRAAMPELWNSIQELREIVPSSPAPAEEEGGQ